MRSSQVTCHMVTKSSNHGSNLAHHTLGHVMEGYAMWLNIQCQ